MPAAHALALDDCPGRPPALRLMPPPERLDRELLATLADEIVLDAQVLRFDARKALRPGAHEPYLESSLRSLIESCQEALAQFSLDTH